jgi:transcription elongation factor Elf1
MCKDKNSCKALEARLQVEIQKANEYADAFQEYYDRYSRALQEQATLKKNIEELTEEVQWMRNYI